MGSNTNDKIVVTDNVSTTPYLFRETEGKQQPLGFRKGLSIASLNVNSLQLHFDEIQCMTNELGIHVLALNETKLNPHVPKNLIAIDGYQVERKDRTSNDGGVAIYIRNSIKYHLRKDLPVNDLELICIEIEPLKVDHISLLHGTDPPSDPVESFKKLENILAFLDKEGKEIILIGDTNCDLSNSEDNNTKHMCELYNLFSLKQLIEEPTRETLSSSTLIDHIATSSPSNIVESGVLQISMSDHFMVFCIRKFNGSLQKEHKMIKSRRMKNFNEQAFLGGMLLKYPGNKKSEILMM